MRKYRDWDNVKAAAEFEQLPPGGYICRIMGAEVKEYKRRDGGTFEQLHISIDIAEGDFKYHYANEYRSQNTEDKRWKGVLRLYLPDENGSDRDREDRTASILKAAIESIEESNTGYHWDWDERKLKGKQIGVLFRSEEWEYNGKTGWKTQPFKLIDVARIREGKFKVPKEKPLKKEQAKAISADDFLDNGGEIISDSDLPF